MTQPLPGTSWLAVCARASLTVLQGEDGWCRQVLSGGRESRGGVETHAPPAGVTEGTGERGMDTHTPPAGVTEGTLMHIC